jgi:uncharacterized protein (DUF433 family)
MSDVHRDEDWALMSQRSPIVSDPEIHNGAPIFAGTRVRVAEVVLTLAKGADMADVRQTWPSLSDAQLDLAHHLAFISAVAEGEASASRDRTIDAAVLEAQDAFLDENSVSAEWCRVLPSCPVIVHCEDDPEHPFGAGDAVTVTSDDTGAGPVHGVVAQAAFEHSRTSGMPKLQGSMDEVVHESLRRRPSLTHKVRSNAARRSLARRLNDARRQAGLSHDQLATRTKLDPAEIARMESAVGPHPDEVSVQAFLRACGYIAGDEMDAAAEQVLAAAATCCGDRAAAWVWFVVQPLPAFGGHTAQQLVQAGQVAAVLRYLERANAGGYA